MQNVSVLGLGPMGQALARAFLQNGHRVTIWNRTKERATSLVQDGAFFASDIVDMISASPVIITCLADYEVTHALLKTEGVAAALAGRILINLSTGTPEDARRSEHWARKQGAEYLDGAIEAWPSQIGMASTTLLFSGSKTVFGKCEPLLKSLAGNLTYMGEAVGAASALHLGVVSYLLGTWLGFAHGAHILETEQLDVENFGDLIGAIAPLLGNEARHQGKVIQTGNYGQPESSMKTSMDSVARLVQQGQEAGTNAVFPVFALPLFKKAVDAGYGNEEVSAIIKILKEKV